MKKLIMLLVFSTLIFGACVNTVMIWESEQTYRFLDIVLVSNGTWYVSYASLADGNKGNYPPDNPDLWGR